MTNAKRRFFSLAAVMLAFVLILSGCGGSSTQMNQSSSYYYSEGAAMDEYATEDYGYEDEYDAAPPAADGIATGGGYDVALENRKVIRYSDLSLESKEFDQDLEKILEAISQVGGYVQSQNMDGQSYYYYGNYYERRATINARIPADKLDQLTGQMGELCNVTSQSERMDDITETYIDTEARLASLKIQEERLLEILKQAETLEDIITLESALSEVRYQIESYTGSINKMDNQVTYSYLNISLREVVEYQVAASQPKNFGERLAETFSSAFKNLGGALEGLLFFVIEAIPFVIVYGGFILLLVLLGRKIHKAWRKKHPKAAPVAATWGGGYGYQQGFQMPPVNSDKENPPEPQEPEQNGNQ